MSHHFAKCELASGHERCLCDARRYWIGIALSGAIVAVYLTGAAVSGSLALVAEGGHALVDALISYGWGILVTWTIFRRPETEVRMRRLGSILNGTLFMVVGAAVVAELARQEIGRIDSVTMAIASAVGVALNGAQHWVIGHGEGHLTNRQMNLHNLGDMIQGLAVLASSGVIALTGWQVVDDIVAGLMALWFFYQGARMLRQRAIPSPPHHH